MKLLAQGGPCVFGGQQLAQLVERDTEQIAQPQDLSHPVHVGLCVGAMATGLAVLGPGQQPDLLVVAQGARGGARQLGDIADAQRHGLGGSRAHRAPSAASASDAGAS